MLIVPYFSVWRWNIFIVHFTAFPLFLVKNHSLKSYTFLQGLSCHSHVLGIHPLPIFQGLEMEYYPALFEQDLELYRSVGGLDYMILGQHYCHNEYDTPYHVTRLADVDQEDQLTHYVSQVIEAMQTGLYLYVAHPDNIVYRGGEAHFDTEMRRLCKAARE